jgi:hypothetical protein
VRRKKRTLYALALLILLGASLMLFILAADEQSVLSSGSPAADSVRLQDLIAKGPGANKHVELNDFYIGRQYIYTAKLVQFKDVYLPLFPLGQQEDASHLHLLLWIRNDRNSNQRLIQDYQDLDRFVTELRRSPRAVTGVLRKPIERVRALTIEAYPGTDREALLILSARDFPTQQSVNVLWGLSALCMAGAAGFAIAYWRSRFQ